MSRYLDPIHCLKTVGSGFRRNDERWGAYSLILKASEAKRLEGRGSMT